MIAAKNLKEVNEFIRILLPLKKMGLTDEIICLFN
jgi:hypothetical protein